MRQFTIEVRVDYSDEGKSEAMRQLCREAAVHLLAGARLLAENVKPEVTMYSDDFFSGHKEISLLTDTLGDAVKKFDGAPDTVSDELLAAARELAVK